MDEQTRRVRKSNPVVADDRGKRPRGSSGDLMDGWRGKSNPAAMTPLTVRRAGPGLHSDGEIRGLYLRVSDAGSRGWLLRFMLAGRRRDMWLGSSSDLTLAEAREAARSARKLLRAKVDPIEHRRRDQAEQVRRDGLRVWTFTRAAQAVHETLLPGWKNPKHGEQWINTLTTYAFPKIGETPVGEIGVAEVMDVLRPIWTTKSETARRVRQRVDAVMRWAVAHGYATHNPVDAAGELLPKQRKDVAHHAAMPYKTVPAFLRKVQTLEASASRLALEFTILTAARSGEVRGATWAEIDLKSATWTIAGERMKAGRAHRVPLSKAAIAVLKSAGKQWSNDPESPIFPNPYGRALSDMALTQLMRGLGLTETVHGFRSSFRDWCAEHKVPRELAERALAHAVGDKTEAAYHRTDQLEQRRVLMQQWAEFVRAKA